MFTYIVIAAALWLFMPRICLVPAGCIHVQDGDSVVIAGRRCRLSGFDAPEWTQPHGSQSTAALRSIVGRKVLAIFCGRDVYGRHLVRLMTARGPVAFLMLLQGHAHGCSALGRLITLWPRMMRRGLWGQRQVIHPKVWRSF